MTKEQEKRREYNRLYWAKNRERFLANYRKRHFENREANNKKRRQWYWDHREDVLERAKQYHAENRDRRREYSRLYHLKNKLAISEYKKKWVSDNRDHVNKRNLEYAKRNPEKHRNWCNKWRKKNPHKMRASESIRRNFERGAVRDMASVQQFYLNIENQEVLNCTYCGKLITRSEVRVDHIIPISKGGHHTADNLAVSCHWCNTSKCDRLLSEWPKCPEKLKLI